MPRSSSATVAVGLPLLQLPPGARLIHAERSPGAPSSSLQAAIAIPARNEADRIGGCLEALARQRDALGGRLDPCRLAVVLLLNNCSDATLAVARAAGSRTGLDLLLLAVDLPPPAAHVGWARRLAMDAAASLLLTARPSASLLLTARPEAGVILSTDADSRVTPNWVAANLAAVRQGADLVAGVVEGEPGELARLNARCRRRCQRQNIYERQLDRLASLLDPQPHDPWPRHPFRCAASMAVQLWTYLRLGGLPPAPSREDQAFFRVALRQDARLRHCPDVKVLTSCRMDGRAPGGVAQTLARWSGLGAPNKAWDEIDSAISAAQIFRLRNRLRVAYAADPTGRTSLAGLARQLGLELTTLGRALDASTFGMALEQLETRSPALHPRRVPAGRLAAEIRQAQRLIDEMISTAEPPVVRLAARLRAPRREVRPAHAGSAANSPQRVTRHHRPDPG
jgi:hypothetical protein